MLVKKRQTRLKKEAYETIIALSTRLIFKINTIFRYFSTLKY